MGKQNLDNLNTLRKLAAEEKTYDEIAEVLGLAYPTVYALARKHNIKVVRKSKIAKLGDDIKRLAGEGKTAKEVASELGVSVKPVTDYANAEGIEFQKPQKVAVSSNPLDKISSVRAERLVEVEKLFKEGVSSAAISRQFGVSREMIRQDLELLGLSASESNKAKRAEDAKWIAVFASEGLTVSEIAEATGLTSHAIRNLGTEFGIEFARLKAVEHGTLLRYRRGCNCQPCRDANNRFCNESKARRLQKGIPEHLHGTQTGYQNWECRCDPCSEAGREANQKAMEVEGLEPHRTHAEWTREEDRAVADYSLTAKELARKLNRTVGAVNTRRRLIGAVNPNRSSLVNREASADAEDELLEA